MEQKNLSELIADQVQKSIEDNQETIVQELAKGIDWDDGWEKTTSKMSFNALRMATRLSVQMTLTMLAELGILSFTPETFKPNLILLDGGNQNGDTPKQPAE